MIPGKLIFFITFFLLMGISYSQNNEFTGIKFNSKNVEKHQRTSIFLNEGKPVTLENSFSVSFDISFWNYWYFGPILRITDENNNEIRIFYHPQGNQDTSSIQIIASSLNRQIDVPFLKRELIRNKWFNLKLTLDKKKNNLEFYSGEKILGILPYKTKSDEFIFVFGIKELNNFHDFDVPGISIKNILISGDNKPEHLWDLNPFEDFLTDKINGSRLKLVNPVWVFQDHRNWRKHTDIKIADGLDAYLGIAYDSLNMRLFADRKKDLVIHNLISGRDSVVKYKTESPAFWHELYYNNQQQLLYSIMTGKSKVSVYDTKSNEWLYKDNSTDNAGRNFGSPEFFYPDKDNLYLLGGYGVYAFQKDLLKYDFNRKTWDKVRLRKNEMTPRAWFAFGPAFNEGEYFIYGGAGNQTGRQEDGVDKFYDLYLLSMKELK
jgi:hypothetical protein